ncbi:MAG: altronate dehydratase family protein [Acidobacteriota bacterium]
MPQALRLHPRDPVAVALGDLRAGEELTDFDIAVKEHVPRGHKVALSAVAAGAPLHKFGQVIGRTTTDIAAGAWVHTHNLEAVHEGEETESAADLPSPSTTANDALTFDGYRRPDGRVGTRNYVGILTSVNCSATVARMVAQRAERELLPRFPNVDGVAALTHASGCALPAEGEALPTLRRTLGGYARHPNFAGVLFLGLGCEGNQIDPLLEDQGLSVGDTLQWFNIQDAGGTRASVSRALEHVERLLEIADRSQRETASAEHLVLGLQCGGSDAFSALTANPALGVASDRLVAAGGSVILAETPEIWGAEHLLLSRARSPEVATKLRDRLAWWQDYVAQSGGELDNNPSPGNKEGGLTTILEKSLGAVAKGGSSALEDFLLYAEPLATKGLAFMDSPGYDPASATGQIASGSTLVCFTTGRGSVSGFKPAPCLKLATNTEMYERMQDDMDLDCGPVLDGVSVEEMGERVLQLVLETASGKETASEELGFGDAEFVPWQPGAVL